MNVTRRIFEHTGLLVSGVRGRVKCQGVVECIDRVSCDS
jgi:hypothetical protein